MATLNIRMPDDKCECLRQLARQRHISLNKLIEELTTAALTQHDLEAHFAARAARGSVEAGLRVLDELDARRGQGLTMNHSLLAWLQARASVILAAL